MLFMGHTCFKNQTRHRATPVDSPHVLCPRLTFARFRSFFSTSFSFDCLPFSVSLFPAERHIPSLLPLTTPSSAPEEEPPGPAGNVSRILQNVSRLSYYTSASYPPTKQRILVWIEFLMEPTPPGPQSTLFNHPAFRRRFPLSAMFGESRALSADCIEASRRLLPISISSGTRYHHE